MLKLKIKDGKAKVKAQAPKAKRLDTGTKNKGNKALIKHGLDGNKMFSSIGQGIQACWAALRDVGINPETATADLFRGDSGSRRLDIEWTNTSDDPFMPGAPIPNSVLVLSWHKMETGRYEMVAYLS
jgi:hypothetical protein